MKRNTFATFLAIAAMAFCGAAAAAAPDVVSHVFAFLSDPVAAGAALAFGPLVRQLQAQRAQSVDDMGKLIQAAEGENRDFTDEEKQRFASLKASKEALDGRIERAMEQELTEAGLSREGGEPQGAQPSDGGRTVTVPGKQITKTEDNGDKDPKRGFVTLGDYAMSVHRAALAKSTGVQIDKRLNRLGAGPQAASPGSTYANEAAGADGGFLIPPGFSTDIFTLSLEQDSFLGMCDDVKVDGNTMSFPRDETTPWGTDGVRAYWQGEASQATATKPVLGLDAYRLKKLMAITPVSDEMLADSSALSTYLPGKMADSIRWKANEAVLLGAGGALPLGAFTGAAAVLQAKDSGQATNTVSAQNLANMMGRLLPGSFPRAVWLVNNDVFPKLVTLTLGNFPIYMAPGSPSSPIGAAPYGMLLGRPIIVTQHANAFSSQGDIMLVDFKGYRTITKAEGITTATSMHLYFDADAMAFRTTFRMDGAPKASKPVTPAKGSNTLSWFVQLEAR